MSNTQNGKTGSKTTKGSNAPKAKKEKPQDRQAVIFAVLSANDGRYPLERIETPRQAIKKAAGGSYHRASSFFFTVTKEGVVTGESTEKGIQNQLRYVEGRKDATTWYLTHFASAVKEFQKKQGIGATRLVPASRSEVSGL